MYQRPLGIKDGSSESLAISVVRLREYLLRNRIHGSKECQVPLSGGKGESWEMLGQVLKMGTTYRVS